MNNNNNKPNFEDYELCIIEHALHFFINNRGLGREDYIDADNVRRKIIKYQCDQLKHRKTDMHE